MNISVVITTYNRPDFLKTALKSVSEQELAPYEIIVIDDCSTKPYDDVYPLAKKLRVRYYKQKSGIGANAARNIGIKESLGNIIAFLDDDDVWLPNYLKAIHDEYLSGADAVVSGFKQLGNEKVIVTNNDLAVTKASLLRGNTYCGMSGFSAKRELLLENLFDECLTNGQDWDMYVRLFQKGVVFKNIPKPVFLYRFQNEDGIGAKIRKLSPEKIYPRLASAYKHREFLGDYWFKKRVSEQILFSLRHKKNRTKWILLSIKLTGLKSTVTFFLRVIKRKVLKKPMSI